MVDYNKKPGGTLQNLGNAFIDFERTSRQAKLNALEMDAMLERREARNRHNKKVMGDEQENNQSVDSSLNYELIKKIVDLESRVISAEENAKRSESKTQDLLNRIIQAKNNDGSINLNKIFLNKDEKYPFAHAFYNDYTTMINSSRENVIEYYLVTDYDDWFIIDDPADCISKEERHFKRYWDHEVDLNAKVIVFPEWFLKTEGRGYVNVPEAEQCDYLVEIYRENLRKAIDMWENSYEEYDDLLDKHNIFLNMNQAYHEGTLNEFREEYFREKYPEYFKTHPAYEFDHSSDEEEFYIVDDEDEYVDDLDF